MATFNIALLGETLCGKTTWLRRLVNSPPTSNVYDISVDAGTSKLSAISYNIRLFDAPEYDPAANYDAVIIFSHSLDIAPIIRFALLYKVPYVVVPSMCDIHNLSSKKHDAFSRRLTTAILKHHVNCCRSTLTYFISTKLGLNCIHPLQSVLTLLLPTTPYYVKMPTRPLW